MEFNNFWDYFWVGAVGALALEIISLYKLRDRLGHLRKVLRNPYLWFVTLGMAAASGFFAWLVSSNTIGSDVTPWQVFLSGTGADGLVRKTLESNSLSPLDTQSSDTSPSTPSQNIRSFFK